MRVAMVFSCAVFAAIASTSSAQVGRTPGAPPWTDTTGESPIYPVGEAIPVYRAVLDLLYLDGDRRPPVIVMWDTAERRFGGGPCPIAKCPGPKWSHKSKIDTSTILAFARLSPKRPGIRDFGYPIPLVFISNDDVHRMTADGNEILAEHPRQDYQSPIAGFWAELDRKYHGAWGVSVMSKVGLNKGQTQALVQIYQWCGIACRSNEILFLKKTAGRWRVVERIPSDINIDQPSGILRYVGPSGTTASESEILVPDSKTGAPPEATARAAVYRAVLDSLYFFQGERPKTVVWTDYFLPAFDSLPRRPGIDRSLARKFNFLRTIRAPLDTRPSYRVPLFTLPMDSVAGLKVRGVALDSVAHTGKPLDLGLSKRYPGAWGMVSMSRVAFNTARSTALVYSFHFCGEHCYNKDTWLLKRIGRRWTIVDRIPSLGESDLQVEPLRYLGLDANPNAYRPRRVQGVVTDYTTGKPLSFLDINVKRVLYSGAEVSDPPLRPAAPGPYMLKTLPLGATLTMLVPCSGQPHAAQIQGIGVMPGMDTTINFPVDFTVCDTTVVAKSEPPPPLNLVSGGQAFISNDSARFVFPQQPTQAYEWDVPLKGAYPGGAEYMWGVQWEIADSAAGESPYLLWLIKRWKAGGPRNGPLKQLIAGVHLEPMVECTTCDGVVFEAPGTDHSRVFATVEEGQLIFIIRGADAVSRIFATIPTTVSFSQAVRPTPLPQYGPGDVSSSQRVSVNCRNSDETPEARHRCDVNH